MKLVEFDRLTDELRSELEGDEQDPWDSAGWTLQFRPKEHHFALRDDRSRLVASAGTVLVEVEVGARRFPVVGLGGVIVNAAHRGRGYAREVVTAALAYAERLGPDFVLLFCHADRAGLYRKLGFAELASAATVDQPDGTVVMPMLAMWRPLRPEAVWPDGELTLVGLPF